MSIFQIESTIRVVTAKFMGPVLAGEIKKLGFIPEKEETAAVTLQGTLGDCMMLNLHLRTAYKVLFLIKTFEAANAEDLKKEAGAIAWEDYFVETGYISVGSSVRNETIRDNRFANLVVKDAIADRFMKRLQKRPDSGPELNHSVVFLNWRDNEAQIYLDTSGQTLARRGYRDYPMFAPLQESLAAAIVLQSGFDGSAPFVNPMCGSGTIAIEAAMIGLNIAPALERKNFAFMHLRDYSQITYTKMRQQAREAVKDRMAHQIIASDHHRGAIKAAVDNARNAGILHHIRFNALDFRETEIPASDSGIVMMNPPYGMRMDAEQEGDINRLYAEIGNFFKQKCGGYSCYIFTASPEGMKAVHLKPDSRTPFMNADIECRLLRYNIYAGTKRIFADRSND